MAESTSVTNGSGQGTGYVKSPSGRRQFTDKFRREAVARLKAGETPSDLAKALKINSGQLYKWRKAATEGKKLRSIKEPKTKIVAGTTLTAAQARDIRLHLKHATEFWYEQLRKGLLRDFDEGHLSALSAYKLAQGE